jgi:hypothetical protein
VLTLVFRQVDIPDGDFGRLERRLDNALGAARERKDRAVVARVRRMVEQSHAGDSFYG